MVHLGAEGASLVTGGEQLDVTLVVVSFHFEGRDFDLLHQLALVGVHCVKAMKHVVLVSVRGGVAQRAKRVHCHERLFATAFQATVNALRLVHDQDGHSGLDEIDGLEILDIFMRLVEVVHVLLIDGSNRYYHDLDIWTGGEVAYLAELGGVVLKKLIALAIISARNTIRHKQGPSRERNRSGGPNELPIGANSKP